MIEGTKKWDDNNNLFGFRPSVDELNSQGLISFEVIRYAEAQPGMRNAIGSALYPLKVVDEQGHKPYQIVWEKVKGKNDRYLFRLQEQMENWKSMHQMECHGNMVFVKYMQGTKKMDFRVIATIREITGVIFMEKKHFAERR